MEISELVNLIAGVVASVLALASGISVPLVVKHGNKQLKRLLDQAKERETFTNCPHCGKKIRLSECKWTLPNGLLDENLNGIPDDAEKGV